MLRNAKNLEGTYIVRAVLLSAMLLSVLSGLQAQLSRPEDPPDTRLRDNVTIYLDFTGASLGRSPYRQLYFRLDLGSLKRYRSYPVADPDGWSTAVFVSGATEEKLRLGKLPISKYIKRRSGVYALDYEGIHIRFDLEEPPRAVFNLVGSTYQNLPDVAEVVAARYRSGYTVRIYEAENVLEPENQLISYPEAVLAATIIGDREQWLWGVHDGRDLLNRPLKSAR